MLDTDTCSYIMKRSRPLVLKRLRAVPVSDVCMSVVTKAEPPSWSSWGRPWGGGIRLNAVYRPEVVISVGARVKQAGESMRGEPVELVARHEPRSEQLPYERLLGDALRGDPSLFTSGDSVEAA